MAEVVRETLIQTPIQMEAVRILKASIILITCLFSATIWVYYYHDLPEATFTHPFVYQKSTGLRIFFATKMHQFWTSYHPIFCLFWMLIAQRICPKMEFGKFGDLWVYYFVYIAAWNLDFLITYRTGGFRIWTSILFIIVQAIYCIHSIIKYNKR